MGRMLWSGPDAKIRLNRASAKKPIGEPLMAKSAPAPALIPKLPSYNPRPAMTYGWNAFDELEKVKTPSRVNWNTVEDMSSNSMSSCRPNGHVGGFARRLPP